MKIDGTLRVPPGSTLTLKKIEIGSTGKLILEGDSSVFVRSTTIQFVGTQNENLVNKNNPLDSTNIIINQGVIEIKGKHQRLNYSTLAENVNKGNKSIKI